MRIDMRMSLPFIIAADLIEEAIKNYKSEEPLEKRADADAKDKNYSSHHLSRHNNLLKY